MSDFSRIDNNFQLEPEVNRPDICFHDPRIAPFKIHGVYHDNGMYRRMPEEVAKTVSEYVHYLHANTAGGRIRFKTNSTYIAIYARLDQVTKMSIFTLCGSAGFDLYIDGSHHKCYRPPYEMENEYQCILDVGEGMHDVTINMPLYSNVKEVFIGLSESAVIEKPSPYRNEKPVVYYGSSITQGGCASRSGTTYQDFISRALNLDFINLGFSGSAKAEAEITEYIAGLDMSVFVYDYDYNAPSIEHLENTHERMFLAIRKAHPELPIIMMSMPNAILNEAKKARLAVIKRTYDNAVARGDKNVYLITGPELMQHVGNDGTVDGTHPTDLGFWSMAKTVCEIMKTLF